MTTLDGVMVKKKEEGKRVDIFEQLLLRLEKENGRTMPVKDESLRERLDKKRNDYAKRIKDNNKEFKSMNFNDLFKKDQNKIIDAEYKFDILNRCIDNKNPKGISILEFSRALKRRIPFSEKMFFNAFCVIRNYVDQKIKDTEVFGGTGLPTESN